MGGYVGIPTSYTPVEYIESSGTQYIDTGYIPNNQTKAIMQGYLSTNNPACGCGVKNQYLSFAIRGINGYYAGSLKNASSNVSVTSTVPIGTTPHTVELSQQNGLIIDNTTIGTFASYTFQEQNTMYLFGWNSNGSATDLTNVRIINFKIYDNGTLVRDFIPVLDDNNVACLYEQVESKFYYNKGTGSFAAGSITGSTVIVGSFAREITKAYVGVNNLARKIKKGYVGVPVSYTPVEYIESTGTQYIDTGIVPISTSRFVADMSLTDLTITNRCGWGGSGGQECIGFGLGDGATSTFFGVCASTNNYTQMSSKDTNRHIFDVSNAGIKLDGTSYANGNIGNTAEPGQTIYLFGYHAEWESTGVQLAKHKVYSSQIYDGNNLVRDFIPVLDDNNIACLYDLVEGKFYYNQGTGVFNAGNTTGEPITIGSFARLCFKIKAGYTIEDLDRFVNDTTVYNAQPDSNIKNAITWYKNNKARILQYYTDAGLDINSYTDFYVAGGTTYYNFYALKPNEGSTFTINYNSYNPIWSDISYSSVEKKSCVRYNWNNGYFIGLNQSDLPTNGVTGLNSIDPPNYQYFVLANYYNG